MALAPLEMEFLSELEVFRVGCKETVTGTCQEDLGVDVERVVISTRRPNERRNIKVFGDLIVLGRWAGEGGRCSYL
jgi:hypothetical protein